MFCVAPSQFSLGGLCAKLRAVQSVPRAVASVAPLVDYSMLRLHVRFVVPALAGIVWLLSLSA